VQAVDGVLVDVGAVPAAGLRLVLLAQQAPPPGQGEEFGKASPVGLVVILLLAVATVFLIRSMSKRIRRLPASFDPPSERPAEPGGPGAGPSDRPDRSDARDADDAGGRRA
jgi:hypothetical protein